MSVEVTVEDKVDPVILETINKRCGHYKLGRHYSVTININLCLIAYWPNNINTGEFKR